jgi:hypothetical protein
MSAYLAFGCKDGSFNAEKFFFTSLTDTFAVVSSPDRISNEKIF